MMFCVYYLWIMGMLIFLTHDIICKKLNGFVFFIDVIWFISYPVFIIYILLNHERN